MSDFRIVITVILLSLFHPHSKKDFFFSPFKLYTMAFNVQLRCYIYTPPMKIPACINMPSAFTVTRAVPFHIGFSFQVLNSMQKLVTLKDQTDSSINVS